MISTCYLLNKTIQKLIEQPWYSSTTKQELDTLFVTHLSQIIKLGFDLTISKEQLEAFSKKCGLNPTSSEYMYFLIGILEQESTYILVNHYQCLFIKALLVVAKKEHLISFEKILDTYGVTSSLVANVNKLYSEYVSYRNSVAPASS